MRLQRATRPGRDWIVVQLHPLADARPGTCGATVVAVFDNEDEARAFERPSDGLLAGKYDPKPASPEALERAYGKGVRHDRD